MVVVSTTTINFVSEFFSLFGSRLIGLVLALISLLLILPITVSLACFAFGRDSEGFSINMKHITAVFLVSLAILLYGFHFSDWSWQYFSVIFTMGLPVWNTQTYEFFQ